MATRSQASGSMAQRSSHASLKSQDSSQAPHLAPGFDENAFRRSTTPKESEADAKLRDRDLYPPPSEVAAFGGRRRMGKVDLGLRKREWVILGVVSVLGAFIRLWKLGYPTSVV